MNRVMTQVHSGIVLVLSMVSALNAIDYAQPVLLAKEPYRVEADRLTENQKNKNIVVKNSGSRDYYAGLVKHAVSHPWTLPMTFDYTIVNQAFDTNSNTVSLGDYLFGAGLTVGDIYLPARLSAEANICIDQNDLARELPFERPANDNETPFGVFGSDQYIGLLAPLTINAFAQERSFNAVLSTHYTLSLGKQDDISFAVGFVLVVRSVWHILDLQLAGASLNAYRPPMQPLPDGRVPMSNSATDQFFNGFSDVNDFFLRGILLPKGILFVPQQQVVGLGDAYGFLLVEAAQNINARLNASYFESVQGGVNVVFPTANKDHGRYLFQPVLGNGGAYQIELFSQLIFKTPSQKVTPVFRLTGSFSLPYTLKRQRITKLHMSPGLVDGSAPQFKTLFPNTAPPVLATFGNYYVGAFEDYDSLAVPFADQTLPVRVKDATKMVLGIGNYSYDVFHIGLRLGLLYEYTRRGKACSQIACNPVDAAFYNTANLPGMLENGSLHTFSFYFDYLCENTAELGFGGLFGVGGKNTQKISQIFVTLRFTF